MTQRIPPACDTELDLHKVDRRGKPVVDWAHSHQKYVQIWQARYGEYEGQRVIQEAEPLIESLAYDDPYMIWYRQITIRFIEKTSVQMSADILTQGHAYICSELEDIMSGLYDFNSELHSRLERVVQHNRQTVEQAGDCIIYIVVLVLHPAVVRARPHSFLCSLLRILMF